MISRCRQINKHCVLDKHIFREGEKENAGEITVSGTEGEIDIYVLKVKIKYMRIS